tara:strand:+ start:223 stop:423 length:201 start_codon:yes stop_codon:yes gene_type:complete
VGSSFVALRWNGTTGMERLEATLGFLLQADGTSRCQVQNHIVATHLEPRPEPELRPEPEPEPEPKT